MDDYDDSSKDLIDSEQLQIFDVIDTYCDICEDITPHHFDSNREFETEEEIDPDAQLVSALSQNECVYCRENEEKDLSL